MMKTLVNFRDAGGYQTKGGKTVKKSLIYRSGQISQLSKEDHQEFENKIGIRTIYDFRGEDEREKTPNDLFTAVKTVNLDISKDSDGNSASMEDFVNGEQDADHYMEILYRDFILTNSAREGYRVFLEDIVASDDPFIFHCFAGKDRTGFGAALLHSLLDVPKTEIYHDFLLSNIQRKTANDLIIEDMRSKGLSDKQLKKIRTMMEVKTSYLDASFEEINQNFGSMENFALDGLKVAPSMLETLRYKLTE